MQYFTGTEYLYIDIANQFGLDKELWEDRIQWTTDNMARLPSLVGQADEPVLFAKAVNTLATVIAGKPTGHYMGLDACASGTQITSVLVGCPTGARNTGLIDTGFREDSYSNLVTCMNSYLEPAEHVGINGALPRKEIKQTFMTVLYGAINKPKEIFGEGTNQLLAFYAGAEDVAPGSMYALELMQSCWQVMAPAHSFTLPDQHTAFIPVVSTVNKRIEVDELENANGGHATFTHQAEIVCPQERGLSLCANITHSVDGMVVREMQRRCNYDPAIVDVVINFVTAELKARESAPVSLPVSANTKMLATNVLLNLGPFTINKIATVVLEDGLERLKYMRTYEPFEVITVHDQSNSGCAA